MATALKAVEPADASPPTTDGAPAVYAAIAAVQGELAKVGIAKNRRNTQGSGYNFRGIDDVYAALAPLLASHGLVVVPRMLTREVIDRTSKNGGALSYVTVHAEFDFCAVADGSKHVAATFGEAMDSGDKATNKAMSAAYKYAAFMTFAIPTEGDNDADATTHEVAPQPRQRTQQQKAEAVPDDFDAGDEGFRLDDEMKAATTMAALESIWNNSKGLRLRIKTADPNIHAALVKSRDALAAKLNPQADDVLSDEVRY